MAFTVKITFPTVFLLFYIVLNVSQNCNARHNVYYCQHPQPDPHFDPIWLNDNYWLRPSSLLYGNEVTRTHFVQMLKGRNVNPEKEDYSGFCAATVLPANITAVRGKYLGFGNLSFNRKCSNVEGRMSCEFTSNRNSDYKTTAKVFVSYFGPKNKNNYHIVVYCLENGNVGWVLASLRRELPESDIINAKRHLQSRGFDPNDFIKIYDKKECENAYI